MAKYCDILWVEDFDDGDTSPLENKIKGYYNKYAFRVYTDDKMNLLKLLRYLEDEKKFLGYSCAVLDINLNKAFGGMDKDEEFNAIKKILEKNKVRILDEHAPEEVGNYSEFRKNSGYYVYLYLVNRGMPPSRICMLTGNKGENHSGDGSENLTDNWEELFENAGIIPPESYDKLNLGKFHKWLEKTLTPAFRLRACIIGMSHYADQLLEDEELKVHLQNLYRIPLRLSEDKKIASPEFQSALWQIVQPWESHEDKDRAYQMTLKTSRNWLAHLCIKDISLITTAFLFGIGLRGLLGDKIRKKLNATPENENLKEYKRWENELLSLIGELDKDSPPAGKKEFGEIVIKSCQEFFTRIKENKVEITTDICSLIAQTVGQKKNKIEVSGEDLLRAFMHAVFSINWRGDGKTYDKPNHSLGIVFDFDNQNYKKCKNTVEKRYLDAVKNTLTQAIN